MKQVQELMVEHDVIDRNIESVVMLKIIKPKSKSTYSCTIPLYIDCELIRAKKQNTDVKKSQAVREKEGILAAKKYLP